jgi:site-specific recombinase XerD
MRAAKEAIVKYVKEVRRVMMKKNEKEQALFLGERKGVRIKRYGLNTMIHRYIKKAGITKKISPHCFTS